MWTLRLLGLGIVLVAMLIAVVPLAWDLYVESWPTVEGRVTDSSVTRGTNDNHYTVFVNYTYQVDGQDYHGSDSDDTVSSIRPNGPDKNTPILIHYNPALPWMSNRDSSISLSGDVMGVCCLLPFGLLLLGLTFILKPQKPVELGKMVRFN